MLKLYIINLLIVMSFSFSALRVETIDDSGRLRFATGKLYHLTGNPESSVRSYLETIQEALGHDNAHRFPLDYYKNGKNSTRHLSFQQTYKDLPVFGRYIRVHVNDDIITSFSSNIDTIELSVFPIITESGALDIIRSDYISTTTYLKYQIFQQ